MAKPTSPTLTCSQCGYENEPERVYCHNCGTKLDRSILPKETVTHEQTAAATRKRVKQLASPGRGWEDFKMLANTLIYAALVAAFYLLLSPPGHLPSREKEAEGNIITGDIENAVQTPKALVVQFTEADISQHLRSRVRGAAIIPGLDFKRAYAVLDDGKVTVGIQQDLFGYALYSTIEYQLKVVDGKFTPEKTGLHFGRLGIDPRVPNMDGLFAKIWSGLKTEQQLMERAQAITVTKDRVVIALKPAAPPAR